MKINEIAFELLQLFEKELNKRESIRYKYSSDINPENHVRLEQDESISYYAWKTAGIFIKLPRRHNYEVLANWQIREAYRILNTALASSEVSNEVKKELLTFKNKLETTPYLRTLLWSIDQGITPAPVVCSGHGVWYTSDGLVDLTKYDSTVMMVSGMGASLSHELAKDIENNQFKPEEVVIVKKEKDTEPVPHINPSPRFFNQHTPETKIPDFCLVDDKESKPKPRVIEPYTMRVLYDLQMENTNKSYFFLSTVLQRFQGSRRVIAWAGCTGVRDDEGNKSGEFLGYRWSNKEEVSRKRKRLEEHGQQMSHPIQSGEEESSGSVLS